MDQHNVRSAANEPYVTSVVYPSRKESGAVYLAFEDGVMLPSDWTNAGITDGDYDDYVAYVSGRCRRSKAAVAEQTAAAATPAAARMTRAKAARARRVSASALLAASCT